MARFLLFITLISLFCFQQLCYKINIGSCHDIKRVKSKEDAMIWEHIKNRKPDTFIWAGDNIYADKKSLKAFLSVKLILIVTLV